MATPSSVKLGVVENVGPNTLQALLRQLVPSATTVDIAVAFITKTGLDEVLFLLQQVAAKGHVRIVTGLYQAFTEPNALRQLLHSQRQTQGRISVRISRDPHFHWKFYTIGRKEQVTVVVGSSNLTRDGLCNSGEMSLTLRMPTRSKQYHDIDGVFEKEWGRSVPLQTAHIDEYVRQREQHSKPSTNRQVNLRTILKTNAVGGRQSDTSARTSSGGNRSYWRDMTQGYLSGKTESQLGDITDWDKKGYGYYATLNDVYSSGDRVVLFDFTTKWIYVVEIKDTTKTPFRTPQGRYFAAYKRVSGISRRELKTNRLQLFKKAGLITNRADARRRRKLNTASYEEFVTLLNTP